jgi:phage shock protein PspC (stress-responsive transcriptional regulator)
MERAPLYRVRRGQGGVLLGLCAGIGNHLGVDPIFVRLVMVLLFFVPVGGFAVAPIYFLFALFTPVRPA